MYVKPQRRQIQGTYVPDNYHGTAFTEAEDDNALQGQEATNTAQVPAEAPPQDSTPTAKKEEGGLLSSLFSGLGGLRSDDLLLLALIVLLWSGKEEHGTSEILPLLAILLFMG